MRFGCSDTTGNSISCNNPAGFALARTAQLQLHNCVATHLQDWLGQSVRKEKKEITDHANPEENGPQRAKERGRRAAQGHPNQSSGAGSTTEAEGAQLDGVHACLSACVHQ